MIGAFLLAVVTPVLAGVEIRVDEATQRYTFYDGERPVLTYNFKTVPVPDGVGGKYAVARSDYVHPIYGPNGEILTKDYSKGHPHHRGIYWAWPEVTYKGEKRDLHALQGVFARPVKILRQQGGKDAAILEAENTWKWGDTEPIVKETAVITVRRSEGGLRTIDFGFTFEALVPGVTLARRGQKAYGGFNMRCSARRDLKIDKHIGAAGETGFPSAWAELTGVAPEGKEPVGLFLLQSPSNPHYPGDWVEYADLAWLQPTFPSKGTAFPLDPKKPLELAFRVIVRHGAGLAVQPEKLFADYTVTIPDPLVAMVSWRPGESRTALTSVENGLRDASAAERSLLEKRLLKLISDPKASSHFKAWACKQLVVAGSDACVPLVVPLLKDDLAWMQAADVLLSRPGDVGVAAMREALPSLSATCRSSLCHLLGLRRDARAVELLASQAGETPSAIEALGRVGSPEAAEILSAMKGENVSDALLQAAEQLTAGKRGELAAGVYQHLWQDAEAKPWHRAAALSGLAGLVPGKSVPRITKALSDDNRHIRNGAAAALQLIDAKSLALFRTFYGEATTSVRLSLLNAWAAKGVVTAEPEALAALADADESVQTAGIHALRSIGGAKAVEPLLDLAAKGGAPAKEAETTLGQMQGEGVDAELRKAVVQEDEARAAVAVECLGLRKEPDYLDVMLAVLKQNRKKTVRAALTALRNDGEPRQLDSLIEALTAPDTLDRDGVARAIVAICKRQADAEKALAGVLGGKTALSGDARVAMLGSLPVIGGQVALTFVTRTSDEAAVRALINWPDGEGVAPLSRIATDAKTPAKLRGLAAAGLVQLAKRVLPSADQRRVLKDLLPHLPDDKAREDLRGYMAELSMKNLALNAAASSSRPSESGHPPAHAVDGQKTLASYWGCTPPPCTLTLDLGRTERIGRVRVMPYWDGRRFYRYRVESSIDGQKWRVAIDASANSAPATPKGVMHRFKPQDARYVRVVMLQNSANPGLHIVELEIYAPTGGEERP
jgi:HEAT repeat protein